MKLAADMGRHSGRATPSLHDTPYRQIEEATGRRSTYPSPIAVQTNPATSHYYVPEELAGYDVAITSGPEAERDVRIANPMM